MSDFGFMSASFVSVEFDFFIAHAGPDGLVAEELYGLLTAGSTVFLDKRNLLPGDDWDHELASAQKRSLVTVVLVSSQSGAAYYQREEIAAAIEMAREDKHSHRVVPVYLNEVSAQDVPYGLRIKHALSIGRDGGLPGVATQLLRLLDRIRPVEAASDDSAAAKNAAPRAPVQVAPPAILPSFPGRLVVQCARCRGTGTRDRDGRPPNCSVCGGAGHVVIAADKESFVNCNWCCGDGSRDRDGREPVCPVCNGIGGYVVDKSSIKCAACAGTGSRDRDGRLPVCQTCSGKGTVPMGSLKIYP